MPRGTRQRYSPIAGSHRQRRQRRAVHDGRYASPARARAGRATIARATSPPPDAGSSVTARPRRPAERRRARRARADASRRRSRRRRRAARRSATSAASRGSGAAHTVATPVRCAGSVNRTATSGARCPSASVADCARSGRAGNSKRRPACAAVGQPAVAGPQHRRQARQVHRQRHDPADRPAVGQGQPRRQRRRTDDHDLELAACRPARAGPDVRCTRALAVPARAAATGTQCRRPVTAATENARRRIDVAPGS